MKFNFLKPSWRKVLADLSANKSRTSLVVASIAVGVFAVGAIATMYVIFAEDIAISYATAQPANIEIMTDPFDEDLVKAVARIPGVANAEGRHMVSVRVGTDGNTWKPLDVMTTEDFTTSEMNLLTPINGTIYPNDRELIVREDPMNSTGLQPGDEALVQLSDGTIRTMPVVGTVGDQYAAGDFAAPPRGYATLDTAEWLGGYELYNRLYVQVEDGEDEEAITEIVELVEDKIERTGGNVYRTNSNLTTEHPMESTALAMISVLGALGVLIMLLSSSLIINTLNALLTQHRRQIGVMKLVGARSFNISVMYIALIIGYGIIALIIAVPLGMAAGYGLSLFMGNFMSVNIQGFRVVPIAIIMQVILAFCRAFDRRLFPREPKVPRQPFVVLLAKIIMLKKVAARVCWISWASGSNGYHGRYCSLFATHSGVKDVWHSPYLHSSSLAPSSLPYLTCAIRSMASWICWDNISWPMSWSHSMNHTVPHKIEQVAYQIPGVEYVEGWGGATGEIVDENDKLLSNMIIIAPPGDSTLMDADLLAGRWLEPEDKKALVVADYIYNIYPDFEPGDTLRVDLPGNRVEDWEVVGVFRFIDMLGDTLAYANNETISRLVNTTGQAATYRVVADANTLERQEQVSTDLSRALRDQGVKVGNVEAGMVTRQQQSQAMNILVIFLLTMAILTAVVGSIGLMGTMGMNVLERTREIGVMRAIGAVDGEIIKSVVIEGLMIGLISWFWAVILSFPISYALLRMISTAMLDVAMPLQITYEGFAIWLGVVVFLSAVASVTPARSAARLTIREVLAYE